MQFIGVLLISSMIGLAVLNDCSSHGWIADFVAAAMTFCLICAPLALLLICLLSFGLVTYRLAKSFNLLCELLYQAARRALTFLRSQIDSPWTDEQTHQAIVVVTRHDFLCFPRYQPYYAVSRAYFIDNLVTPT